MVCVGHNSAIGKSLQNSNTLPGFKMKSFETLINHLEWNGKKLHGYVHFRIEMIDDNNEVAKDVCYLFV